MLKRIINIAVWSAISACVFAGYRATIAEMRELSQSEIGVVAAADGWSWSVARNDALRADTNAVKTQMTCYQQTRTGSCP